MSRSHYDRAHRLWRFGVFVHEGRRGPKFTAYSLWFSPTWEGYVGIFEVEADTRAEALREAIRQAREKHAAPATRAEAKS